MRKYIVFLLMLSCIFILTGCNKAVEITVPDNVSMVSIAPYDSEKMTFCYTDAEKVQVFVNYIQSLTPSETKAEVYLYAGMNYIITLHCSDGTTTKYEHYGNLFFRQENGVWGDIPYEQASKLDLLLKEYEPDIPAENPLFQ